MASSRVGYHQDYIARIRHSNALPAPPLPPKLLEISTTGLSSGAYTSASFASRLAREQPLNVESDVFLGMDINLVGLKGVFENDDSAIMFPEKGTVQLDPEDRALLRPLSTMGKPTTISSGVSFLRRTEYITSGGNKIEKGNPLLRTSTNRPQKKVDMAKKDDPIHILRSVIKSFDLAYPEDAYTGPDGGNNFRGEKVTATEREAWTKPRHPTRPDVKLVDAYPLLPDPDGIPDGGAYAFIKFQGNPSLLHEKKDPRTEIAIMVPQEGKDNGFFDYYIPEKPDSVPKIKRKLDKDDEDAADDDQLYDYTDTAIDRPCFKYKRMRMYEPVSFAEFTTAPWSENVIMALHDSEGPNDRLPTAAYIYPVGARALIKPKRTTALNQLVGASLPPPEEDDEDVVDELDVYMTDPDEEQMVKIEQVKTKFEPSVVGSETL